MAKGELSEAASGAPGSACALLPEEATGEMEGADTIQPKHCDDPANCAAMVSHRSKQGPDQSFPG
jgi:hypothetical protein